MINDVDFVIAWQAATSPREAADLAGYANVKVAQNRACRMRRRGDS